MKKKLLFIINTMGRAGAETALIELLKKLDALAAYEISLYAIIPRGELFARVPAGVHVLNRRARSVSVLSPGGRAAILRAAVRAFCHRLTGFRMLPYLIRNVRAQRQSGRVQLDKLLWRLLAQGRRPLAAQYDLAVAYIEGAAAYFLADKVRARHKAAFIHIDYQRAGYLPMMDQGCYDGAERIFVVAEEVGRKFAAVYPQHAHKIALFRNILDLEGIRARATEGKGFEDGFDGARLVTVGRLTYQKGYDVAIETMARIKADGRRVRWYVLGEGPERANLERLIERHGLRDDFVLLGAKDNPYPYVLQADIYVHATRFEGKSIAIEEAQVLGKPIVASDCTGSGEQIQSGHDGLLVPLDAPLLAEALEGLLDQPQTARALGARAARRQLTFPEDLDQLLSLMDDEKGAAGHEGSADHHSGV